jgi:hypothetical protein
MYVTPKSLEALAFMLPYLPAIPPEVGVDFTDCGVQFQANTQEKVRAVRLAFPGATVWTKQWNKYCGWLEYTTAIDGMAIVIWAVKEAPPSCQIIEEEVEVEREVPVTFETRLVKETRRRIVCSDAA